jgi:prolyl-tRNA editing enzyme YbaK/EbsC (Cys-tRNA(Pro) deacylase)
MTILNTIRELLQKQQCVFRELHHEPTLTSEDAARVRNEPLRNGGKALLMKIDTSFALFVLPANRRANSKAIRRELGIRKTRFATAEELAELTSGPARPGLVPGSVPPFGEPILPFPLYVDSAIRDNQRIAFNAGSLTDSIIMDLPDYLTLASPQKIFEFSQLPD